MNAFWSLSIYHFCCCLAFSSFRFCCCLPTLRFCYKFYNSEANTTAVFIMYVYHVIACVLPEQTEQKNNNRMMCCVVVSLLFVHCTFIGAINNTHFMCTLWDVTYDNDCFDKNALLSFTMYACVSVCGCLFCKKENS